MNKHPSLYQLKLWLGGEAPDSGIEAHLNTCPACQNAVERLQHKRQAFLENRNGTAFVNEVWQKSTQDPTDKT